jgi:hypothetical protein
MRNRVLTHGYGSYTDGCRCRTCKDAKADYQARRRAEAYSADHEMPENVSHGCRSTYEEHGCRCGPCKQSQAGRHPLGAAAKDIASSVLTGSALAAFAAVYVVPAWIGSAR